MLRGHPNLYRSDGLVDLVNRFLPVNNLSELSTQFEACTVNIDDARLDFHSAGDPRKVLVASASLPGVFKPVVINGSRHVDGGIASTLPVHRAHDLGRDDDLRLRLPGRHQASATRLKCRLSVCSRRRSLSRARSSRRRMITSNVIRLPAPDIQGIGLFDFSQGSRLIAEGHDLVAAFLAEQPQSDSAAQPVQLPESSSIDTSRMRYF